MKKGTIFLFLASLGCIDPTAVVIEPLRVINWSPGSGVFCVDVNTGVSATFSDDLENASLTTDTFLLQDASGPVAATLSYDVVAQTAMLQPGAALAFDTVYTVVAAQGIRGREHGSLSVNLEATFKTIARYGCTPGVECVLPSDCPDNQICANIGVCIDECVTDKDCYRGTCDLGDCIPQTGDDGGDAGGDPNPGD